MNHSTYELYSFTWQDIEINIRYCPGSFVSNAHIEIESACRSPLPITETGFRSHFAPPEVIAEFGGPVAFVEAMLEHWARKNNQTGGISRSLSLL